MPPRGSDSDGYQSDVRATPVVDLPPMGHRFSPNGRTAPASELCSRLQSPNGCNRRFSPAPPHTRRKRAQHRKDPILPTIEVTPDAAEKAKKLLAASPTPAGALRVRVIDGGCSGMRYELVFDGEIRDDDEESEQHGLRVLVDAESATYLEGTSVGYSNELNDAGLKIENPRADTTCGCGESFNVV